MRVTHLGVTLIDFMVDYAHAFPPYIINSAIADLIGYISKNTYVVDIVYLHPESIKNLPA
ncbi:glutamate receptor 3.5 [Aphanothece sacrum FPU1]|uniref:Glutamate receptor 3.5 n=1 Tax=Aphanothece sacrum FPU1 TaxID=1920663 RepID=A0A401IM78_APHSA|nr:glutamate receptor 3.5 [Aphanothece sacrum FPU1]GBF84270.1 hypothetical protein AsFPU3_1317 [Aphanothece sacrum FPU3]